MFSDVDFNIRIDIDAPLAPGTPSGFPAFVLQRTMTVAEIHTQGGSLRFEIEPAAVLDDGVRAAELVGNGFVLRFDGREVDNGRFHPALLELDAKGTGRIHNSNNAPTLNPLVEVDFGEEYITDLVSDPGNTTLITAVAATDPLGGGGGGAGSLPDIGVMILFAGYALPRRLRRIHKVRPDT